MSETLSILITGASRGIGRAAAAIRPETKALYIETPTNPMMNVTDIRAAAELAHAHGALLKFYSEKGKGTTAAVIFTTSS